MPHGYAGSETLGNFADQMALKGERKLTTLAREIQVKF